MGASWRSSRVALDAARWARVSVDVSDCDGEAEALERVEARLREERAAAEGRPLAVRVLLSGTTPLHARLVARREAIEADARALGFRVADDLWVEQLKIATLAPPPRADASFDNDALDVEALVREAADHPDFEQALAELLAQIGGELPRELREALPAGEDALKQFAAEARDRLNGEIAQAEQDA